MEIPPLLPRRPHEPELSQRPRAGPRIPRPRYRRGEHLGPPRLRRPVVHHEIVVDQSAGDAEGRLPALEPLDGPGERTVRHRDGEVAEAVVDYLVLDENLPWIRLDGAVQCDAEHRIAGVEEVDAIGPDERRIVDRGDTVFRWVPRDRERLEVAGLPRQRQHLVGRRNRRVGVSVAVAVSVAVGVSSDPTFASPAHPASAPSPAAATNWRRVSRITA